MKNESPQLIYQGSVKDLWQISENELEFRFSDAYSIFDWGRMPDLIPGKGQALATMAHWFFVKVGDKATWIDLRNTLGENARYGKELAVLCEKGMSSHFLKKSADNAIVVRKFPVVHPETVSVCGKNLFQYKDTALQKRFIPLEVVFRLGLPQGSSFLSRMTPELLSFHDFKKAPKEGDLFEKPLIEFFTKLEDTDRPLTWDQALNISHMKSEVFEKLILRTELVALWLQKEMKSFSLELWDGKLEWAVENGEPVLVDSIGPDEMRIIDPQTKKHLSKEVLRQYYKGSSWYEKVQLAKSKLGAGEDWVSYVKSEFHEEPKRLSSEVLKEISQMYQNLSERMSQCLQSYKNPSK